MSMSDKEAEELGKTMEQPSAENSLRAVFAACVATEMRAGKSQEEAVRVCHARIGKQLEDGVKAQSQATNVVPASGRGTSWFQRHLNWTYFLAWFFLATISGYLVMLAVGLVLDSLYPPPSPPEVAALGLTIILLAWTVGYIAVMIPVSIYVLRRKGRSLWWMLFIFSYIPVPMFLKNHRAVAEH